jgi:hypothetical protein
LAADIAAIRMRLSSRFSEIPRGNPVAFTKLCTQKLIAFDSDHITRVIGPFHDSIRRKAAGTSPWRLSQIILYYQRSAGKLTTVPPPTAAAMFMLTQKFAERKKRQHAVL